MSWPTGRQAAGDALGRSHGGLSTKIHLAVCINIQRRASGSLKTGHVQTRLLRIEEPGTTEVVAFLS